MTTKTELLIYFIDCQYIQNENDIDESNRKSYSFLNGMFRFCSQKNIKLNEIQKRSNHFSCMMSIKCDFSDNISLEYYAHHQNAF